MIRKHMIFYGRVQGVGFRYYCVRKAQSLGLTGWVRNLPDGAVDAEIQGMADRIEELVDFLEHRSYVEIRSMEETEIPLEDEWDFREKEFDLFF